MLKMLFCYVIVILNYKVEVMYLIIILHFINILGNNYTSQLTIPNIKIMSLNQNNYFRYLSKAMNILVS